MLDHHSIDVKIEEPQSTPTINIYKYPRPAERHWTSTYLQSHAAATARASEQHIGDEETLQGVQGAGLVTFSRHAAGPHQVRLVPHEDGGHPRLQPRHRRARLRQARALREAEHGDHAVHRAGGVRRVLRMRSCSEAASLCSASPPWPAPAPAAWSPRPPA